LGGQDRPKLDKRNRLEKLDFQGSVEHWQTWRVIRNRLTHHDLTDDALKAAYLNEAQDE
jgi:hypothetical protein